MDSPDGKGDYETLVNVRLIDDSVCENPTNADARRVTDGMHWSVTEQGEIDVNGFVCKNTLSDYISNYLPFFAPSICDDFEVRFCCPERKLYFQYFALYSNIT